MTAALDVQSVYAPQIPDCKNSYFFFPPNLSPGNCAFSRKKEAKAAAGLSV